MEREQKVNYTYEFHARAQDPTTSHQAAATIDHFGLKPVEKVLLAILEDYICNDDDLYARFEEIAKLGGVPLYTPQAIRTMRCQMWRNNLVHVAGVGKNSRGRNARLWTACKCGQGQHD